MTAGNWIALGSLMVTFAGFMYAVLGAFTRRVSNETSKVSMAVESLRQTMGREIADLDERLRLVETGKVSHQDWVRVATSQLNRMNRISEQISEMAGRIEATIGMGGAINRIASAIEKKVHDDE